MQSAIPMDSIDLPNEVPYGALNSQPNPNRSLGTALADLWNFRKNFRLLMLPAGDRKAGNNLLILDGLRGLAMIWVLTLHVLENSTMSLNIYGAGSNPQMASRLSDAVDVKASWWALLAREGELAVDVFFLLSGFLIAMALHSALKKNDFLTVSYQFLVKRILRLWPVLAVCLLLSVSYWSSRESSYVYNDFYIALNDACKRHWWADLTFTSNLAGYIGGWLQWEMCAPWTWTVSSTASLP